MAPGIHSHWIAMTAFLILQALPQPADGGEPMNSGGPLRRARAAFRAGRFAEALEESRGAAASGAASVEALLAWGRAAEYVGELEEARKAYGKATAREPNDPEVTYRMASMEVRVGEYGHALRLLDKLPTSIASADRLLLEYLPGALTDLLPYRRPRADRATQMRIDILMEQGDLERARRLATETGVIRADESRYCGAARERMAKSTMDDAFRALRLAALGTPQEGICILWLGRHVTDEGFVRMGRVMLLEAIRVLPAGSGGRAEAEMYLRARLSGGRDVPKRVEQLSLIGRHLYVRDGDIPHAVKVLEKAMQLDPAYARPYLHLARIASDQGRLTEAVTWLQKALHADPDSWRAHRRLGQIHSTQERYREAETHLRKAVDLFPLDIAGKLALARVLFAQRQFGEYVTLTREALDVARGIRRDIPEVGAFLVSFERSGPSRSLPPAPDPRLLVGLNYD